ncbi:TonB-dependent receptor domain-containing protein [Caulobacter mirabilis]|uniref:TonB-dependent receptor domain-containing protein n=1 Tax=Caulobacter mirabilis TaxID=69666 RepID=UPI001FED0AF6|nr:TonB-dependent receptor [Caulobacter mirabilis]
MAALAVITCAGGAYAQDRAIQIAPQPLSAALNQFGAQSGQQIIFTPTLAASKRTQGVTRTGDVETSLRQLLQGTGLTYRRTPDAFMIIEGGGASDPQSDGAPSAESATVEELIVTAQKKEESIQTVPIAVSAFSAESLDERKIEGGAELLRAVPNVNFSKANFSGYNFSIRGIGTKAVSAGSDPAVAVSFNNTPLIRNRLFESEFFDVQRVEVLRGPQGTLYGRNATGGVVNMLPAMPTDTFEGQVRGEVGNYETRRLGGFINVPIGDTFAVRLSGAMTQRDGFDYNSVTQKNVNGRDLWSIRGVAEWEPTDRFKANFIWQHFEEDDTRSRTGKQLCTNDPGPRTLGGQPVSTYLGGRLSQGCLPGSLYDDAAYGVTNGASFAHVYLATNIGYGMRSDGSFVPAISTGVDPYGGLTQSRNLREIATAYDPVFRAKNDVYQLNLEWEIADGLTLVSQTAYAKDDYYSSQDYNRFNSNPIFNDSVGVLDVWGNPMPGPGPTPGGVFTDPQLGPSNKMLSVDISQSDNRQWSQEFRLQSSFDGAFNFNVGVNYLDFKSQDDYYVFNNVFSLLALYFYNRDGAAEGIATAPCPPGTTDRECIYVDPNPLNKIDGQGHNYFRSMNLVSTKSYAVFGEGYWRLSDALKFTAGLRYTLDRKVATPVPSQLLLAKGPSSGGNVNSGYPKGQDIKQEWGRFSGRLVLDWTPNEDTLVYASFARGYKGGGANPPRVDIDPSVVQYLPLPETFRPEYVNAFEIGAKNTLLDGKLRLNATAFYYDYSDYQVSQIVDRISLNENFDATTWGLELEAVWRPTRNFQLDGNLGYLKTRIGKGAQSIDVMNRTQGDPDWMVVRPWLQVPSNCIAPRRHVERIATMFYGDDLNILALLALCNGSERTGSFMPGGPGRDWGLFYGIRYDPMTEAPNGGRGFAQDLEGNELPNAPNWTMNLGAQYTFVFDEWDLTLRGDYYRQSESYARVYNTEYDRLKAWDNVNLSLTLRKPSADLMFQVYVKNAFDKTPITDTFTNSDDTGLTANVFTLDPRIIGVNLTKGF